MNVFTVVVLIIAGVIIGRLGAKNNVGDCPRCAIEDEGRRTTLHISAQARTAKDQMQQAASRQRYRGTGEDMPTSRFGGDR